MADQLLPLDQLRGPVARLLGRDVDRKIVSQWVRRGRLVERGRTPAGEALYRGGDYLDLVRDAAPRPGPRRAV